MNRGLNKGYEDKEKDSTDSDRYCLDDNLDLLNLRTSFSFEANNKPSKKSKKQRSKRNEIYDCKQTKSQNHQPRRCQHYRDQTKSPPPRNHYIAIGDDSELLPTKPYSKPRGATIGDHLEDEDDKSVQLLYTNERHFQPLDKTASQDSFLGQNRKKKKKAPKVRTVNIHTRRGNCPNMGDRSMSTRGRRSPPKDTQAGDGKEFPFQVTPSGHLKVNSDQVVFSSNKLSILVADPERTKVNIQPNMNEPTTSARINVSPTEEECTKHSVMESIMGQGPFGGSLGSLIASTTPVRREKESSEYEGRITDNILDPELNLNRLGYTASDPIDWHEIKLPEKSNLYMELHNRITTFTNADCKVYIDNEEFNCHLIVLQCYSQVFDEYVAVKKVELPSDKVSTAAFAFIYDWMITAEAPYLELTRETVLDIFNASKYLKIKDLMEQCWAFIDNAEVFSEDTAFLLYMDANQKDEEEVKQLMLPRIQKFFLMLVSSQDWLELEKEDVISFLSSNYICVNCEMEVFMSAVRWLKHDWDVRLEDALDLMACIRFGNIAPWQLVDVKRNPENPEFLKLTSIPQICKMIDDGLAFVIIKYWYGQQNDDFQHWNNILGLVEPTLRNWSGMDKAYFTYREFLIYLDQYRRNQMIEKTKPKDRRKKLTIDANTSPRPSLEDIDPRLPTMDEFLNNKRPVTHSPVRRRRTSRKHHRNHNEMATIIQAAYRGYRVRKMLKKYLLSPERRGPKEKPTMQRTSAAHPWPNQTNFKVLSMFTNKRPFAGARGHFMNELSASVLSPVQKDYLAETSLFLADRESVLVFGGIDPHRDYGVGRNTGKDVLRYLPDENAWEYVGDLPEPRHQHSVAFLKGRVYLCGGADPRDDDVRGKSVVVDTVWSFEPVKRCWFSEGSLSIPRKNFGLVTSNYGMYAIGGQDRQGRTLGSVERFNPETGSWEFQAPLNNPRIGVACTKYRDYIWAVGGMSGSKTSPLSDSVECYDIRKNQWTEITRLRFPRCLARVFTMSDKLYLIGGAGRITEMEKTTTSVSVIDVWDNAAMEWRHQADMSIPRHGHATAYLGTQILIIGGVTTIYMRALCNVECYCTERGTWVRGMANLPSYISGHAAITLPPASLM